jgi:peroxiredoxin Q/BCP
MSVEKGQKAPEFELSSDSGEKVSLKATLAKGPVMLVFYPGDFTPTCTQQLCSYRNSYADFQKYGIQILGINADDAAKHEAFKTEHRFPFPLLTDPDKKVSASYGMVSKLLFGMVNRGNFIVGRDGTVLYKYAEALPFLHRKSEAILEELEGLKASGKL